MKKLVIIFVVFCATKGNAQFAKSIFSKEPIINLENFQKQKIHFGFFLGFNSYDYKIDYKTVAPDVLVKKSLGFNVGIVSDVRLNEYFNLRFEPGLYYAQREMHFPGFAKETDAIRDANAANIHFPILLKFSSLRTGNIRPYLLSGLSATLNLSSNSKSPDDNLEQRFRVKNWTTNYELGLGIDLFSEYFILSTSLRGTFGLVDELIRDKDPNSPWTSNIASMKTRAVFLNFTFH